MGGTKGCFSGSPAGSGSTVVACATPWGRGAISVLRASGPQTGVVVRAVCGLSRLPVARRSRLVRLRDEKGVFDEGLLTWMPGPASYTGEDSAEISCHGNPLIVERLLATCVDAGARIADPGEFTRRAFLNGRLDLTRAEAVLQAIQASTPAGLDLAWSGLRGDVAAFAEALKQRLLDLAATFEAMLDFPDEDLDLSAHEDLGKRLASESQAIRRVAATFTCGQTLVEGARVALVGPVNAGKSSLFNRLVGRTRALVDEQPGTTRDVVECRIRLGEAALVLLDTAGEREDGDRLERRGQKLRDELLADVDLLVVVLPAHRLDSPEAARILEETASVRRILVGNHSDRSGARFELLGQRLLPTSATRGDGIDALKEAILEALLGEGPGRSDLVLASQRQRDLLLGVASHVDRASWALEGPAGVAVGSEELVEALHMVGQVGGLECREEVLDALFSRFCVGK
jgi:tRNA modification GTPase